MQRHHASPLTRTGSCRYGGRLRAAALYMCPLSGSTSQTQPVCRPRRPVTSSRVRSSASCTLGELFSASATAPTISSSRREDGVATQRLYGSLLAQIREHEKDLARSHSAVDPDAVGGDVDERPP